MTKRKLNPKKPGVDKSKLNNAVCEILGDDTEALLADGFEKAAIGVVSYDIASGSHGRVVYDYDVCVAILMSRDGMSDEEAIEYMEFNVVGGYVGEGTPVFLKMLPSDLFKEKTVAGPRPRRR